MSQIDEIFNPENKKHLVLVVDDELINRSLLGQVLSEEYEVLYAEDGNKALAAIRDNREELSLILLDLIMPGMHGLDLLKLVKSNKEMKQIPVIVLTSDHKSEVPSLLLGASDFIPKPYPMPEVILARVKRTIELFEDRVLIQSTEKDTLTGLYNREYFFRYADQFDRRNKELPMDAILVNINQFHIINERYGKEYGNEVLCRIAEMIRRMIAKCGCGYACRPEADTFLIYSRHDKDGKYYKELMQQASEDFRKHASVSDNRIRLRMGVYPDVDKNIDIERRFDRAKMAADTGRASYEQSISYYDNILHKAKLYEEQLLDDFKESLVNRHFRVYYQPKFNVRQETPVLASAEALVRWEHPRLGMISPSLFVPLLEDNSLVQQLDHYVWREAAAQIRQWKDTFGVTVPVSVNVSRIDMYDPNIIDIFKNIIAKYGLTTSECLLEITESAYTGNSDQIINTVRQLRNLGFQVEMDDFGSGYSSLNMLSTLPIDALKLDMHFIRTAFTGRRDTRLIELIIDIAEYLKVPVIAEGVETEEQFHTLKALGCDLIQGYYFSKPVPPEKFEKFVIQKKQAEEQITKGKEAGIAVAPERISAVPDDSGCTEACVSSISIQKLYRQARQLKLQTEGPDNVSCGRIVQALVRDFFMIYYVNLNTNTFIEFESEKHKELQIESKGADFFESCLNNAPLAVHEDDLEKVLYILNKENMLRLLKENEIISVSYRLIITGSPVYVNMKIILMEDSENISRHAVVGISNIDAQTEWELNFGKRK